MADSFDPDAFLQQTAPSQPTFDPDAFLQQTAPKPQQLPAPNSAGDYWNAIKKGVASIPGDVAGTPRMLEDAGSWLGNKATNLATAIGNGMFGAHLKQMPANYGQNASGMAPPEGSMVNKTTGAAGMPNAQGMLPRIVGNTLRTGLNPLNLAGGGGVAKNIAGGLAAGAVGSGAAAVAKQANFSPAGQAVAGGLGGLLGGGLTGAALKSIPDAGTTAADQAKTAFEQFRNGNAEIDAPQASTWAMRNQAALEQQGLDSDLAPSSHRILNNIQKNGSSMAAPDITALNQKLSVIANRTNDFKPTSDAVAAMKLKQDFNQNLPNMLVPKPTNAADLALLANAKKQYSAATMAQQATQASDKDTTKSILKAIDKRFGSPQQQAQLTPQQQNFVNYMKNGSPMGNAMSGAGKVLTSHPVQVAADLGMGALGYHTHGYGGALMGLLPSAAGYALKGASSRNMMNNARALAYALGNGLANPGDLTNTGTGWKALVPASQANDGSAQ